MISREPIISVGILDRCKELRGGFMGTVVIGDNTQRDGDFAVQVAEGTLVMSDGKGDVISRGNELLVRPADVASFVLHDVLIGIKFHWERRETQAFEGNLRLVLREDGTIAVINDIPVEKYLESVISSEMSAEAPMELLQAHAITSRSWLVAMLEREERNVGVPPVRTMERGGELIRWYDREDHDIYDVCADDHCQRYHGVTKIISRGASEAIEATRGLFLVSNGQICDARFSKSCGGLSEQFESAWEDTPVPYLVCISDGPVLHSPIASEEQAEKWILSSPAAYCNTTDGSVLRQILPSFDRETTDFFRWRVDYTREELESLIAEKSGIRFGTLLNLTPVQRGPSGRIVRLRIEGTEKMLTVGKELEIRRWLSRSHLYSSAFVVRAIRSSDGVPTSFTLHGAGWGHGVGLCQIGAAVMATKGWKAEDIVKHYFSGAELKKLY